MPLEPKQQDMVREYIDRAKPKCQVNICLFGASGVGRKSILKQPDLYDPIGDDSWRQILNVQDKNVLSDYFVISSQEMYPALLVSFARSADAFVFVYDVADRKSFARLDQIRQDILSVLEIDVSREAARSIPQGTPLDTSTARRRPPFAWLRDKLARRKSAPPLPVPSKVPPSMVIANKIDLPKEGWAVSAEEGQQFSERIGASFVQASAKTSEGCTKEVMAELASRALYKKAYEATPLSERMNK
ncbi:hypothetical protein AAE478_004135 [Parahypoxylon ruwenzoriense]